MGNKVIDGSVEWIKDDQTGDVVGYKRRDGTERGIASVVTNEFTGGNFPPGSVRESTLIAFEIFSSGPGYIFSDGRAVFIDSAAISFR